MDPLTIIVTALIAGAAAGGQDAVSAAVRDAYVALRNRIGGDGVARAAVEANETAPGGDMPALEAAVREAGANEDGETLERAERLLSVVPAEHLSRHFLDMRDAKGIQVGNQNTQRNTFH